VLDAAKARGLRTGENPAAWKGNLGHILPRPKKLAKGHLAAMPHPRCACVRLTAQRAAYAGYDGT
jgi:hypothetical protein